jgi:hypothetical protein
MKKKTSLKGVSIMAVVAGSSKIKTLHGRVFSVAWLLKRRFYELMGMRIWLFM